MLFYLNTQCTSNHKWLTDTQVLYLIIINILKWRHLLIIAVTFIFTFLWSWKIIAFSFEQIKVTWLISKQWKQLISWLWGGWESDLPRILVEASFLTLGVSILFLTFKLDWVAPSFFQFSLRDKKKKLEFITCHQLSFLLSYCSTIISIYIISFNSTKYHNSIIFDILKFKSFKNLAMVAYLLTSVST